jgi:hypothetical protein
VVDLVRTGLTVPGDVPLRPAADLAGSLGPVSDRDVPLRVMVGADDAYRRGALRRVLVVAALALLLVAGVSLLAALRKRDPDGRPVPSLTELYARPPTAAAPSGTVSFPRGGTSEH